MNLYYRLLVCLSIVTIIVLSQSAIVFGDLNVSLGKTRDSGYENLKTERENWTPKNKISNFNLNDSEVTTQSSTINSELKQNQSSQSATSDKKGSPAKFSLFSNKEKETPPLKPLKTLENPINENQTPIPPTSHNISFQNVTGSAADEEENDVCFPVVGCFAMGKPWKSALRPIYRPDSPENISTTVIFYSREQPNRPKTISLYPNINMNGASFDSSKITAIIIHGFASSGYATWMKDMKDAYLKHVDANVLLVNWEKGSNLFNYLKVAGNTRVVGKQMEIFVKYLMKNFGADPKRFHIIGHSLGAQICAYLAKNVPGIARLTALDPAQPGFEGFDKVVRLDKSDAEFVDVVHTSAKPLIPTLGFGMIAPHGHIDFYMNGGYNQPGCYILPKEELPVINNILDLAKYPVEVISKVISCPHGRSYDFLIEAFNETEKCIFWGHKADVTNVLQGITNTVTQGLLKRVVALSPTCEEDTCVPLGFTTQNTLLRGSFVVTTSEKRPFCIAEPGIIKSTENLFSKSENSRKV